MTTIKDKLYNYVFYSVIILLYFIFIFEIINYEYQYYKYDLLLSIFIYLGLTIFLNIGTIFGLLLSINVLINSQQNKN